MREKHFKCIWWWCRLSLSMTIVLCVCFILFFKPWPQKVRKNILLHTFAVHFSSLILFYKFYIFIQRCDSCCCSCCCHFIYFLLVETFQLNSQQHAYRKSTFTLSHTRKKLFNFLCLPEMMKNCHRVRLPFIRGAVKVFQCLLSFRKYLVSHVTRAWDENKGVH